MKVFPATSSVSADDKDDILKNNAYNFRSGILYVY